MLNYQTQLAGKPPPFSDMAAHAQKSFQQSPYSDPTHQDVFGALGQRQAVNMDEYARQAGESYANAAQQQQRELALAGLQMMSQGQQQQNNVGNSRLQMLLGGLL
jgi:hypothetical protein